MGDHYTEVCQADNQILSHLYLYINSNIIDLLGESDVAFGCKGGEAFLMNESMDPRERNKREGKEEGIGKEEDGEVRGIPHVQQ